jgi:hypothetical protein
MPEHDCKFESVIEDIQQKVSLVPMIYDRLVGDPLHPEEKPGLIGDVAVLKAWRESTTKRVKRTWAWVYGVLGAVTGGIITACALSFIFGK